MKNTPLSVVKKIYPSRKILFGLLLLLILISISLIFSGVTISLFAFPSVIAFAFLLLQRDYSDKKRFIIMLSFFGLSLTLLVELIVLSGDIGRMNTVFKFYLQAWTFFSISSSWYLFNIIKEMRVWQNKYLKKGIRILIYLLSISVLLFPIIASFDKMTDRISQKTPLTLDGMEYMRYSTYTENNEEMNLNQDYALIQWMQDNIEGSPVIIEANVPEYRWGNRITIYTGLPGVIGWNWHQRQQRAINPPDWIYNRIEDVNTFYSTGDMKTAKTIIDKYSIDYVVVGQLEKIVYDEEGIEKFSHYKNNYFEKIYDSDDTTLYKVILE